ncbi:ATP-binding protein [Candidatus Saccharibacteria bacterium]|nr:ATP-binding protein [Candidatus Saccharibacteria bacterium]MCB9821701.1 ATP-binding protein [Candidatus Nomurabacteria bacterium]
MAQTKLVLTGGPHSGKTTLFNQLKEAFPEAHFVPEPAESVILRELDKQAIDPDYTPILPTTDYPSFLPIVVDESLRLEALAAGSELVICDRSLVDNLAFIAINAAGDLATRHVSRLAAAARYSFALFLEQLPTYANTPVRRESREFAARIALATHSVYANCFAGNMADLPAVGLEARAELARQKIEGFLAATQKAS